MEGTETKRFCAECGLHVHNVSAMTADEAAAFLAAAVEGKSHGERVCVRLFSAPTGPSSPATARLVLPRSAIARGPMDAESPPRSSSASQVFSLPIERTPMGS